MKKFFAVVFVVLLLFSRLVAADDVTYNFSTLGSGVTFISRANSTVFANHSVHTWLGNLSSLEERLYFDDAAVRSKDFYANEFVPGLPASVLKDKGNKTYFYLRGNNYLLLDF
ncbi:TPA: hypothetical protein HA318_01810, partial [Candidatus Micrarchaeota archaeon]|nr:hypothetical protein [Candidatus Micrarchaeota archaeon]